MMGKSYVAVLALLALEVSCCLAQIKPLYLNEFAYRREEMGEEIYGEPQWLLEKAIAWRKDNSLSNSNYANLVEDLLFKRPIDKSDAPYLFQELKARAADDPDQERWRAKGLKGRAYVVMLIRGLIIDPCKHYDFSFSKFFNVVEKEDPKLVSYAYNLETRDFYNGWAALTMCKSLLAQLYSNTDLIEALIDLSNSA